MRLRLRERQAGHRRRAGGHLPRMLPEPQPFLRAFGDVGRGPWAYLGGRSFLLDKFGERTFVKFVPGWVWGRSVRGAVGRSAGLAQVASARKLVKFSLF